MRGLVVVWMFAGVATARAQTPETPPTPAVTDPAAAPLPPPAGPAITSTDDLLDQITPGARIPDIPALDLLGAETLEVTRPGSIRDLGTELRALYKDGKVVPQVAVELSPYDLFFGGRTTASLDRYQRSSLVRMLHRTSVSIATTATGEDANAVTLGAVGLRVRLIDETDWRLDTEAIDCALRVTKLEKPSAKSKGRGLTVIKLEADDAKKVTECLNEPARWNARQLGIGFAASSAFPGGELRRDLQDTSAWLSLAEPLGTTAQLVVSAKHVYNDARVENATSLASRHTAAISAQVERRSEKLGFLLSAGVGARWTDDTAADRWERDAVGMFGAEIQLRVADETWLSLRFSGELVEGAGDDLISLANFKWSYDVGSKDGD